MAKKKIKEQYLKIPYHILDLSSLELCEKVLLAHIYSFGQKGCWQSNATLGEIFFVDGRTVSRWMAKLKKLNLVLWVHPKGRYRTIWAQSHPQVKTAQTLLYMNKQISKKSVITGHAAAVLLRQNCPGGVDKSVVPTATNQCNQVGQNCLHTNNTTKKDIMKKTIASPSPLPAGGQAPAPLEERRRRLREEFGDFKMGFGLKPSRAGPIPTDEQMEQRRQSQLRALRSRN